MDSGKKREFRSSWSGRLNTSLRPEPRSSRVTCPHKMRQIKHFPRRAPEWYETGRCVRGAAAAESPGPAAPTRPGATVWRTGAAASVPGPAVRGSGPASAGRPAPEPAPASERGPGPAPAGEPGPKCVRGSRVSGRAATAGGARRSGPPLLRQRPDGSIRSARMLRGGRATRGPYQRRRSTGAERGAIRTAVTGPGSRTMPYGRRAGPGGGWFDGSLTPGSTKRNPLGVGPIVAPANFNYCTPVGSRRPRLACRTGP